MQVTKKKIGNKSTADMNLQQKKKEIIRNNSEPVAMENGAASVRVTQLYWLTPVGAYLLENFESPAYRCTKTLRLAPR